MTTPPQRSDKVELVQKSATIYDVAKAADVSHQSVSRYMRGLAMRPGTRSKIEKALQTLHYRPNLAARALTSGRSNRIGALTHEMSQVGPSLIIQGATHAAREAGYLLDVVTLDMGDVTELNQALGLLTQHNLAGILAFASTDSTRAVFEETEFGVPALIAAETEAVVDPESGVGSEHQGVEGLVNHLVELGHTRFIHIAGPPTWAAARNRAHAVESALTHRGLPPAHVVHGDWSARSGSDAVHRFVGHVPATAVMAANDQMALGAIHALTERGLSVPDDVSVTGIDDTPESAYFCPALTTVRLDFGAQGRAALAALLNMIDGTSNSSFRGSPREDIILRHSTAPAR